MCHRIGGVTRSRSGLADGVPEGADDSSCFSLALSSSQITLHCVSLFGVEEVIDTGMKHNLGTVGRND